MSSSLKRCVTMALRSTPPASMTDISRRRRSLPLVDAGLVAMEPGAIQVTAAGWYVVRAVAAVFDRYLQDGLQRERFSRMV
jgi:hypothetical protein